MKIIALVIIDKLYMYVNQAELEMCFFRYFILLQQGDYGGGGDDIISSSIVW